MDCRRVNLFIGEPNVGKSNILEAFTLLNKNDDLTDFMRFDHVSQLFFDFDTSKSIEIQADEYKSKAWIQYDEFRIESIKMGQPSPFLVNTNLHGKLNSSSYNDEIIKSIPKVRFYKFKADVNLAKSEHSFLKPPFGSNLGSVVMSIKELRTQIQNLLEGLDYKLLFKPDDGTFGIYKEQDGFSILFPISLVSDTVKRMIFYLSAISSNQNVTVLFEEPESNTFPYYIKYLAERIAKYSDNQYFITTHNPYFFLNIIEKTPLDELTVNVVRMEHYQTNVRQLGVKGIEEALNLNTDVFLNFDKLFEA